jgi:hypothetical protein
MVLVVGTCDALLPGMASRFDQPSSDDTTVYDMTDEEYLDWSQEDAPLEYDGPTCIYCGEPLPDGATDYCSALCACYADKDNAKDRL